MPEEKLTLEQLGQKIKTKYPQYKDMSDTELANKMIEKFPVYKDMVISEAAPEIKKKEQVTELPSKDGSLGSENATKPLPKKGVSLGSEKPKPEAPIPNINDNSYGDVQPKPLEFRPFIKDKPILKPTQQVTPKQDLQNRLKTITPELIGKEEKFVVPELNYQFKDQGFKFEEATPMADAMNVTAPNGKVLKIDLDPFTTSGEVMESNKLKKFISENSIDYDKINKVSQQQSEYKKRFIDQKEIESANQRFNDEIKLFDYELQQLNLLQKGTPEYTKKANELAIAQNKLISNQKELNKSAGKYVEMKESQGTYLGYLRNQLIGGITGAASGLAGLVLDVSALPDAAKKQAKAFIQPGIRESLDYFKDETTKEYAESLNFVGEAIGGLVQSLPAMLAGEGLPIIMAGQISDGLDQEMKTNPDFENISELEKLALKTPMIVGGALLEKYGLRNVVQSKGLLNNIVLNAIGKSSKNTTVKSFEDFLEQEIKDKFTRGVLKVGAGGLAEFETGASQELLDITTKDIYNAVKEKKMFQTPETFGEKVGQVFKAGLQEAIGGFILSVPSAISASKGDYTKLNNATIDVLKATGNDATIGQMIETDLKMKVNSGDLTPDEAEIQLNDFRESVGVLNSINTEGMTPEQVKRALPIAKKLRDLKNRTDGKVNQTEADKFAINELKVSLDKITNEVKGQTPVADLIDKKVSFQGEEGVIVKDEGGKLTFETPNKIIELQGDEMANAIALPKIEVKGNNVKIDDELFNILSTNKNDNGEVVSVTLRNKEGQVITNKDADLATEISKQFKNKKDAIQEQTAEESVLRNQQPEMGLQEMGEGDIQETPEQGKTEEEVGSVGVGGEVESNTNERVVYDREPTADDGVYKILGDERNVIYRVNPNTGRIQEYSDGLWSNTASNAIARGTARTQGFQKIKDPSKSEQSLKETPKEEVEQTPPASDVETFELVENEGKWKAKTKTYKGRETGNWVFDLLDKKQKSEYEKIKDEADTYGTKEQAEVNFKKLQDFESKNKEAFVKAKEQIDNFKQAEQKENKDKADRQKVYDKTANQLSELSDLEFEKLINLIDKDVKSTLEKRFGDRIEKKQLFKNRISEAYHKAKADGSNPELVKAVESLLSKEQTKKEEIKPIKKQNNETENENGIQKRGTQGNENVPGKVQGQREKRGEDVNVPESKTKEEVKPTELQTKISSLQDKIETIKKGKEGKNEILQKIADTAISDLQKKLNILINKQNEAETKAKAKKADVLKGKPKSAVEQSAAGKVKEKPVTNPRANKGEDVVWKDVNGRRGQGTVISVSKVGNSFEYEIKTKQGAVTTKKHSEIKKKGIGVLANTIKKYSNLDVLTPRTLILRYFATGGKVLYGTKQQDGALSQTGYTAEDLFGFVSKNGRTYSQLYENIMDELQLEDFDQGDFNTMVSEILQGGKQSVYDEIKTHLVGEAKDLDDPINWSYNELLEVVGNENFPNREWVIEQIGEMERAIADELSPSEIDEAYKNIEKYTVDGVIDWDAIANDKEVKQLNNEINEKQDTKTESTASGDSTPISQEENDGQQEIENIKENESNYILTPNKDLPFLSESGNDNYPTKGNVQREEDNSQGYSRSVIGVWNKTKDLQFTGTTKVRNAEDVAHIMRLLENKNVEHGFAVHVDAKGNSHIQYLSVGGTTGTVIDSKLVLAGLAKFKSKKVYLVHNHPSGALVPSKPDISITQTLQSALGKLDIDLEHVIMDTYSNKYVLLDKDADFTVEDRNKDLEDNSNLTVHVFNEQKVISIPQTKVTSSKTAAEFIQQLRFTAMPKNAMLLLSQNNDIIGNYVFKDKITYQECVDFIGKSGIGTSVIFYGNQQRESEAREVSDFLKKMSVNVLDHIITDSNGSDVAGYYKSLSEEGMLEETQAEYGTNSVSEPNVEISNQKEQSKQRLEAAKKAFIKKSKNMSSGGFQALPEFVELIKSYIADGIITAKEFIERFKDELPGVDLNEKLATKQFDKIYKKATTVVDETTEEVKKTIATSRVYEGNVRAGVKRELEKLGLTRDVENQQEAKERAIEFVNTVGVETALEAVRNNDVSDAAGAYVWNEILERLDRKISKEKDPTKLAELEKEQAGLFNEFSRKALSGGRFSSALADIYQNSDIGYNVENKIQEYRDANNGQISEEVEEKFRELDAQYKEVKQKLAEAEERAIKAEGELAIKNIQEAAARTPKQKVTVSSKIRTETDWIVSRVKDAQLNRPGMFLSATPASLVWDGAVKIVAGTIKVTGRSAEAIAKGLEHIVKSDWYKSLSDSDKKEAEKQFSEFWVNKETIPGIAIKIPNGLIRRLVEEGATTIEEVVEGVKDVIKEEYPDITDREIRDAITQYGKIKNLSKDEILASIRKIKRIGRIVSALEDVNNKKRPLRSGLQRDKLDAQERALNKELRELMKELPIDAELEAKQQKTALDATKQRITNQIEDLQREIDKGMRVPLSKRSMAEDAELTNLKEKRDKLKIKHDEIFKDESFLQAKRLDATKKASQRAINDLRRRLKEKDFTKKEKSPLIKDSELLNLQAEKLRLREEYDKEIYKAKLNNRTKAEKTIDALWNAWGLTRLLRATGEFSFVGIQGLVLSISNPTYALKSFMTAMKFFGSESRTENWLNMIKSQEWYPEMRQSKLSISEPRGEATAREELFLSDAANFVWNILGSALKLKSKSAYDNWKNASPFKAFERAAVGYLDTMRVLKFLDGREMLHERGIRFENDPQAFKDLADVVNTFTGRASIGPLEQIAPTLTKVFFSPRNWASALKQTILFPRQLYKWRNKSGTPGVSIANKIALLDYSKFIGLTMGLVIAAAMYYNDDDDDETGVETDPTSSDFGKIKIGNTRVDPWGGRIQQIVFLARIIAGSIKNGSGEVVKLGTPYRAPTRLGLIGDQAVNKLAPSASMIQKFLTTHEKNGVTVDQWGNPYSITEELKKNAYPIYWDTVKDLLQDDPTALDGLLAFYAFFGGGVNVYDKKIKPSSNRPIKELKELKEVQEVKGL